MTFTDDLTKHKNKGSIFYSVYDLQEFTGLD